jgi:hypothetical protein
MKIKSLRRKKHIEILKMVGSVIDLLNNSCDKSTDDMTSVFSYEGTELKSMAYSSLSYSVDAYVKIRDELQYIHSKIREDV